VLAFTYWEMGRADEAIPVLEQVTADSERILGPGHQETLTARAYLALSYREVGRTGEAIAILEQIAPQSEGFLRPYHRLGTIDRLEMAPLYATAGRTEEAIAAAEWGVADRERSCGPADPLTIAAAPCWPTCTGRRGVPTRPPPCSNRPEDSDIGLSLVT
jgi:hypothetical protein